MKTRDRGPGATPGFPAALTIPLTLRGWEGQVTATFVINDDPLGWGFGSIELGFDPELTRGYPVCTATIAYQGAGYDAVMGLDSSRHC